MNNLPLVSVIVAFYNIEECVDYCVESILRQTVSDYELLLIDDGSTDGTSQILDTYKNKPRITVFHKSNGGLSDARNFGIKHAKGRYLTFIDGDDVVSPLYLELLIRGLDERLDVFVTSAPLLVPMTQIDAISWCATTPHYARLSNKQALRDIAYEKITASACGKLAPRAIYLSNPFPVGDFYEEIATIGGLATSVHEVVVLDTPIYGYVMRGGSVVNRKEAAVVQAEDYLKAINILTSCLEENLHENFHEEVIFQTMLQYSRLYMLLQVVTDDQKRVRAIERGIVDFFRANIGKCIADRKAPILYKARFALMACLPSLYRKVMRLRDRKIKGLS